MERLSSDMLTKIFIVTGQESWPILCSVSKTFNEEINMMTELLVKRLAIRCACVPSHLEKVVLLESLRRHYMKISSNKSRKYNIGVQRLLRSRLAILTKMSNE